MTRLETKDGELYLQAFGDENKVLKGWESFSGWYWFATELNKTDPKRPAKKTTALEHERVLILW